MTLGTYMYVTGVSKYLTEYSLVYHVQWKYFHIGTYIEGTKYRFSTKLRSHITPLAHFTTSIFRIVIDTTSCCRLFDRLPSDRVGLYGFLTE